MNSTMKKNRIGAAVLLCAMLLGMTACGDAKISAGIKGSTDTTVAVSDAETEAEQYKDFQEANVNMLVRTEFLYEFSAEEGAVDIVDEAVYQRDAEIENLLNIHLDYTDVPGSRSNSSVYLNLLTGDIMSEGGDFDLFASAANYMLGTVP